LTRFTQSVRDIVELAQIPGRDINDADIFRLLRAWLLNRRNGEWLIILDNADDVEFLVSKPGCTGLVECIPTCLHGALILTSRDRGAAIRLVEDREVVHVSPMDERTAITLLAHKLDQSSEPTSTEVWSRLVRELDYIPLAIAQAATFLLRTRRSHDVKWYLEALAALNNYDHALLNNDHGDLRRDVDASNSIILTWQISFEHLLRTNKTATDLLSLMSLCDRHRIPEFLIKPTQQSEVAGFERDLQTLLDYSFVTQTLDHSSLEMHRLVQLATRRWLTSKSTLGTYVVQLVHHLYVSIPSFERDAGHTSNKTCEIFFPHAMSALQFEPEDNSDSFKQWITVLYRAGSYASLHKSQGFLRPAAGMFERCCDANTRVLGENHSTTLMFKVALQLSTR
jgi:hypothetical protein